MHTLLDQNVQCNFTNKSLELNIINLEDKDYIFTISNLLNPIDPAKSTVKVKTGIFNILFCKHPSDV